MKPIATIPGATIKVTVDGLHTIEKLKTQLATFNFRPVDGKANTYLVQVTCKELPGLFKNSGASSFGSFLVTRYPARNEVRRPKGVGPKAGNAVLMWPHLSELEKNRCLEYVEKIIRERVPRLEVEQAA